MSEGNFIPHFDQCKDCFAPRDEGERARVRHAPTIKVEPRNITANDALYRLSKKGIHGVHTFSLLFSLWQPIRSGQGQKGHSLL